MPSKALQPAPREIVSDFSDLDELRRSRARTGKVGRTGSGRPCRARTCDQRIMHTTSAFAARFRFVVWTLSCLSAFPSSLYTFSALGARSFARHWQGACAPEAFTEFGKFYVKAE